MEDEVIARLHKIYKQVSADFGNENCFLTGSMAVYFLAKQLSVNNRGLIPNDVDILVNSSYDFISRGPPQKSIKYNAGTADEYDVIRTKRKNKGIKVQSKHGDETLYINVQAPKLIKDEYEDQKERYSMTPIIDDDDYVSEEEFIENFREEGHDEKEIFEWYLVSDWFIDKLREKSEPVIDNDYGEYWGRCCMGQAIYLDLEISLR